jgi:tRNA(Met) C34 N-acetyltransferase TmcA
MYYEVPGDAQSTDEVERIKELQDINQEQDGALTMEADRRGKSPDPV